jgi:hypothetical protein
MVSEETVSRTIDIPEKPATTSVSVPPVAPIPGKVMTDLAKRLIKRSLASAGKKLVAADAVVIPRGHHHLGPEWRIYERTVSRANTSRRFAKIRNFSL